MLLSADAVTVTERVEQNNIFQHEVTEDALVLIIKILYVDAEPWLEMMVYIYILKVF